jgi:hypothetical protein
MMLNFRMLPPPAVAQQTVTISGRRYSAAPGSAIDAPDMDARVLGSNGWVVCAPSGTTAQRPTTNPNTSAPYTLGVVGGFEFYDTSLSKLIFWDGQTWRDPTGAAV